MEFYEGDAQAQLGACVDGLKSALTVKASGAFIIGNVKAIRDAGALYGPRPRILHEPELNHNAHAAVRLLNDDSDELLSLLADEAWGRLEPAMQFV